MLFRSLIDHHSPYQKIKENFDMTKIITYDNINNTPELKKIKSENIFDLKTLRKRYDLPYKNINQNTEQNIKKIIYKS